MNATTNHIHHGKPARRNRGAGRVYDILSAPALSDAEAIATCARGYTEEERIAAIIAVAKGDVRRTNRNAVNASDLYLGAAAMRKLKGSSVLEGANISRATLVNPNQMSLDRAFGGDVAIIGGGNRISAKATNLWNFTFAGEFSELDFTNAVLGTGTIHTAQRMKANDAALCDVNIGRAADSEFKNTATPFSTVGDLEGSLVATEDGAWNLTGTRLNRARLVGRYDQLQAAEKNATLEGVVQIGTEQIQAPISDTAARQHILQRQRALCLVA